MPLRGSTDDALVSQYAVRADRWAFTSAPERDHVRHRVMPPADSRSSRRCLSRFMPSRTYAYGAGSALEIPGGRVALGQGRGDGFQTKVVEGPLD